MDDRPIIYVASPLAALFVALLLWRRLLRRQREENDLRQVEEAIDAAMRPQSE